MAGVKPFHSARLLWRVAPWVRGAAGGFCAPGDRSQGQGISCWEYTGDCLIICQLVVAKAVLPGWPQRYAENLPAAALGVSCGQ